MIQKVLTNSYEGQILIFIIILFPEIMYETSLLIFNHLFTGNNFTQNIKLLDSRLNLKYDFLKCSWNSYCFKYKLAGVPEGMNVFYSSTADHLNVEFYLHYLYSFLFRDVGAFLAALLPHHTDCLGMSGGEGMEREAFGQAHCPTVPDQT